MSPHYKSGVMELDWHLGSAAKYLLRAGRKGDALPVLTLYLLPALDTPEEMLDWVARMGQPVRVNLYRGEDGRLRGTASVLVTKEDAHG